MGTDNNNKKSLEVSLREAWRTSKLSAPCRNLGREGVQNLYPLELPSHPRADEATFWGRKGRLGEWFDRTDHVRLYSLC